MLNDDSATAPLPFSDFQLQDQIGEGGKGTVYRALQKSLQRPVAVKMLKRGTSGETEEIQRFLREARAIAQLRHPHIVGVHGVGRTPAGDYFLVMDLVDGSNLADRLSGGPIPIDEAVEIVATVAGAIVHAHQHGVVHRDLKPSNVLSDKEGTIYVTDFGLAKLLGGNGDDMLETTTEQIIGTLAYMAPEQADRRWGEIGPLTDVFGLGALMYHLLTSRPPFVAETKIEMIAQIVSDEAPAGPETIRSEIPASLSAICMKCLNKEPVGRNRR